MAFDQKCRALLRVLEGLPGAFFWWLWASWRRGAIQLAVRPGEGVLKVDCNQLWTSDRIDAVVS